jgi:hypothetical protein
VPARPAVALVLVTSAAVLVLEVLEVLVVRLVAPAGTCKVWVSAL